MEGAVQREDFTSGNPEEAHGWLRAAYGPHTIRLAGSSEGFRFESSGSGLTVCTSTH